MALSVSSSSFQAEPVQSSLAAQYKICVRCVMDSSDPEITFDDQGVCNHCHDYDVLSEKLLPKPSERQAQLERIIAKIREEGRGKAYDCVIGVSGGVDSTYVAYLTKQWGLRALAIHLDNGWDSELAVSNIEKTLTKLGIELYTHVIDWEEFKDLQLSFLKASTPDSEIPSDHAIVSIMRLKAKEFGIRTILSGCNVRTESHLPRSWSQGHSDWKYIKAIHRQFGKVKLRTFPHLNLLKYVWFSRTQKWIDILNFVDYRKDEALKILQKELGWVYYGGKHYESIYTRFYQGVILPTKFGYDKRRSHFSSLVCAGEITRTQALEELKSETYPKNLQIEDQDYVSKKFNLSDVEWKSIMALPRKKYEDYPNSKGFYENSFLKWCMKVSKKILA